MSKEVTANIKSIKKEEQQQSDQPEDGLLELTKEKRIVIEELRKNPSH